MYVAQKYYCVITNSVSEKYLNSKLLVGLSISRKEKRRKQHHDTFWNIHTAFEISNIKQQTMFWEGYKTWREGGLSRQQPNGTERLRRRPKRSILDPRTVIIINIHYATHVEEAYRI